MRLSTPVLEPHFGQLEHIWKLFFDGLDNIAVYSDWYVTKYFKLIYVNTFKD